MDLLNIKNKIVGAIGRGGLVLQKHSPEILLGVGIVGVVASTVLACKATLKLDAVLTEANDQIDRVKKAKEIISEETYSQEDFNRDLVVVHTKKVVSVARLYAPAAILGLFSIGALVGSNRILNNRNVAIVAAYKLLQEGYSEYRKRIAEEFGEDREKEIYYGMKREVVEETVTDENGKKKKVKKTVLNPGQNLPSEYARWFDESSREWRGEHTYNLFFLKAQQNYLNDMLNIRGHVFLNEVYDCLGMPRSKAGAVVGWIREGKDSGDGYIDFGIWDENSEVSREFVNGYGRAILLDFNVDGLIWELI